MSERGPASNGTGSASVGEFLGRVRRRLVLSSLLAAAAFAALVNEAVRWSSAAAIVHLGWKVPILGFLGLLVLAVLVLPTLRRWTPAAAAARADARLGLRDRLASWVDFRGRAEIPEALRQAQAGETARALADTTPVAAVPIAPWRKAGPVLLAVCLVYQFFLPDQWARQSPLVSVIVPAWRLAPPLAGLPAGEPAAPPDGAEPRSAKEAGPGPASTKRPAEGEDPHGRASPGGKPAEQAEGTGGEAKTPLPNSEGQGSVDRTALDEGNRPGEPPQPARIESERVGARLAQVVEPLYRAGSDSGAAALPAGIVTFKLLPQAGAQGAGGGPGDEAVAPEPVRVDLDAVPAPYRPIVKAYFEQLARAPAPPGGTPPEP